MKEEREEESCNRSSMFENKKVTTPRKLCEKNNWLAKSFVVLIISCYLVMLCLCY
jgi:hypothetical protein